jgi:hypothetical protein
MSKLLAIFLASAAGLTLSIAPCRAADPQEVETLRETTRNLIRLLVEQGVLTPEKAEELVNKAKLASQAKADAAAAEAQAKVANGKPPQNANVVRVPLVPETVKREIREQVKQEVLAQAKAERWGEPDALPEWVDRFKFDGDFRLRFQGDRFGSGNASREELELTGFDGKNTRVNRDRFRVRARLGIQAKVTDNLSGNFRLATGNFADPVSTNQTLGNYGNRFTLALDRAYLYYQYKDWMKIYAGRFPNPWFHTDLVWDEDLHFDGIAANARRRLFRDDLTGFVTAGIFPIQDVERSQDSKAKSKWLYGAQGGLEWLRSERTSYKFGLGLYNYANVQGKANPENSTIYNDTQPQFRQKGNTVFNIDNDGNPTTNRFALASKFRELNLTAMADLSMFDPIHIIVTGDYVKNLAFDRTEIRRLTGSNEVNPGDTGFQAKVAVGAPSVQNRGDWQAYIAYKRIEIDAVLDAFTDSDFRLGGTNAKGYVLGGSYGLQKNTWLSLKWLSADEIETPVFGADVLQLDLNMKF